MKDSIGYKNMVGAENFENFLFYMKFDDLNNEFWVEDDLKQFKWFNLRRLEVKKMRIWWSSGPRGSSFKKALRHL